MIKLGNTIPETGVFHFDFATYRSIDAVSATLIDKLHDASPAHVLEYICNPTEPTAAMEIGTAIHFKCLEPDLFDKHVEIVNSRPQDKSKRKPWKTLIRRAETPIIDGIAQSMEESLIEFEGELMSPAELISRCKTETTLVWRDPVTNMLLKARPDLDYEAKGCIIDIKSTADMAAFSVAARSASAYSLGYHRRASFYIQGYTNVQLKPVSQYYFLVCEKYAPFGWKLFKCSDEFLNLGAKQVRTYLNVLSECFKTNTWPSYEPKTQTLELPGWVK
jgi:hypothetical protein